MVCIDGRYYDSIEDAPDLGSLVCVSFDGTVRNYEGLDKDVNKLPKYDDLSTGSSAFIIDTSDVYKYVAENKTWYKI